MTSTQAYLHSLVMPTNTEQNMPFYYKVSLAGWLSSWLSGAFPNRKSCVRIPVKQNLLEYKAMNVEKQRRIFVEPWSDSIHIALRRNNGFLHSFHDFSKSNAFSENFMRTNFILHKILFRMSILSGGKTSWMFSNLH